MLSTAIRNLHTCQYFSVVLALHALRYWACSASKDKTHSRVLIDIDVMHALVHALQPYIPDMGPQEVWYQG
jgi:hypothetical protein